MPDIPQTRQSLLLELGRKSESAWVEFLQVYEGAIFRMCRSKGLQDADAQDVTQEVLAAVHARVATWDSDPDQGSFRGWLMRVARNISIDSVTNRARRSAGHGSGDSRVEQMLNEAPDPWQEDGSIFDLEYSRSMFAWAGEAVRGEVRSTTWKAFQLTSVQGLSAEDAAAQLGLTVGSVYTAKCRVVARIRAKIIQLEGGPSGPA
ncbi:MAG: sigma-70 family RNA polymerase sigma factor [Planctomycetota bacterium]|nr:sigma-70 family RNA polymerase sigma factor [Planctomycetota bacterium]